MRQTITEINLLGRMAWNRIGIYIYTCNKNIATVLINFAIQCYCYAKSNFDGVKVHNKW